MAVVVFDVANWRKKYPSLSAEYPNDETLQGFFDTAALTLLDNTDNSIVQDVKERAILFDMLVCHLAELARRGPGAVGTLSSASEGSVSAGFSPLNAGNSYTAQWYSQTQCGAAFYRATMKYRLGGYYFVCRTRGFK